MLLKFFKKKSGKDDRGPSGTPGASYGVDPESNYCPGCGGEYRADIWYCQGCDRQLISGRDRLAQVIKENEGFKARSMAIGPADDLVAIRQGSVNDIKRLQQLLADQRIPSLLGSDRSACGKGCCGAELILQVKRVDLEAAGEILAKDFIRSTALESHDLSTASAVFDAQAAETVCPACGCRFSPTVGACPDCGLSFE